MDNNWHNIVGTWDGSTMYLYIDGVLKGSKSAPGIIPYNGTPLIIGAQGNGSNQYTGLIDDVRVYSRGLSSQEVQSLYYLIP